MNLEKFFSGRIFNLANLFLILLVSFVLWNTFLSVQYVNAGFKENRQIYVRVLDYQKDQFNRLMYYFWSDNGMLIGYSPKLLNIGSEYQIKGVLKTYDTGTGGELYKLSLGVLAEINIKQIEIVNKNCDLICNSLKNTFQVKHNIQTQFLLAFCTENKDLITFLLPTGNCKDVYALSVGLVLGGTQEFSDQSKSEFKKLGLTHLVAFSGFQVVLVISLVEYILLRLNISRSLRVLLSLVSIGFLVMLVGPQPPVLRSGISIAVSLSVLYLLGRRVGSLRSLTYSLLIMLLINPFYVFSASFQLSGLATLGLILNPSLKFENLNKFVLELINSFLLTTWTFLFTLPIIVNLSGFTSPFAIISNILILPFVTVITLLNVLGLIPVIGGLFFVLAAILESLLLFFVHDFALFVPRFGLEKFGVVEIAVYYLVLVVVSEGVRWQVVKK